MPPASPPSVGCGATTLAVNLAAEAAARHDLPTVLLEASTRLGRLAVLLNIKPDHTTQDLFASPLDLGSVSQALTPLRERLHVLAGPYQNVAMVRPAVGDFLHLIDLLRRLADFVVIDMPYTFDEDYFAVLGKAETWSSLPSSASRPFTPCSCCERRWRTTRWPLSRTWSSTASARNTPASRWRNWSTSPACPSSPSAATQRG
jgi:hypothetical protein